MKNRSSLLLTLVCLTVLFIAVQIAFFIVHYKVSNLIDSIASSSISSGLLHLVILRALVTFILLQLLAYGLFIMMIWFIATSLGELFAWSDNLTHFIGILAFCLGCDALLFLNAYYYPDSFFAQPFQLSPWLSSGFTLAIVLIPLLAGLILAFVNYFRFKRHRMVGSVLLWLVLILGAITIDNKVFSSRTYPISADSKPNIIIIGLDSLRPDYTGYFGNHHINTPNIDSFLSSSTTFTHAYTPLARTFPSWVSILTGLYPKHSHARINLAYSVPIVWNNNIAKELQAAGYETMRATDESRFANITESYGFDRIVGPKEGAADFLLGGLSDFPLSNLLVNLPFSRFLFPYNYGNRAAAITYNPDSFLQLVASSLANRPNKPLFLAIHFCLPHWPFTWARDGEPADAFVSQRYQDSVEAVDVQLGKLLQILKADGLLENSVVVLLSDHGVALALPGDNITNKDHYLGPEDKLSLMRVSRYSWAPENSMDFTHDYGIDTSYGQGTEVASLIQHHVLLAIKGYNIKVPVQNVSATASLIDVAPTLLDYLKMPKISHADGISLMPFVHNNALIQKPRPIYMETADKVMDIETDKININKVVQHTIQLYRLNPETGLLYMDPAQEVNVVGSKERAILMGDWLLARYPEQTKSVSTNVVIGKLPTTTFKIIPVPPYYLIANLKTGKWTIGLNTPFAKTAPVQELMSQLKAFYGQEVTGPR